MSFDRKDKCPICKKDFQSNACPHTWDYVYKVMSAANSTFDKDVAKVRKNKKR